MTPRREPGGMFPPPSPSQGGSRGGHKGGNMWGAAAEAWGGSGGRGRRTPGQGRGGNEYHPLNLVVYDFINRIQLNPAL